MTGGTPYDFKETTISFKECEVSVCYQGHILARFLSIVCMNLSLVVGTQAYAIIGNPYLCRFLRVGRFISSWLVGKAWANYYEKTQPQVQQGGPLTTQVYLTATLPQS